MVNVELNILEKLLKGVDTLADIVKSTLGPMGRMVLINKGDYPPYATKDGVTVANEIDLGNSPEGTGAALLKQAARRTVEAVGDGTTTATVLTQALLKNGIQELPHTNVVALRNEISSDIDKVVEYLHNIAIPADTVDTLVKVATLSANGDTVLGKLIGETVHKVGEYGDVKVESYVGGETTVEYVQGYTLDKGYDSPFYINTDRTGEVKYNNVLVALFDQKINTFQDIEYVCKYAADEDRPLVIVAHYFDAQVLHILNMNQQKGYKFTPIQAQGAGSMRRDILSDLAVLSGGMVLPNDDLETDSLGSFESVIIRKNETTFIGGEGAESSRETLIKDLSTYNLTNSDLPTVNFMKQRVAKLRNGVAILKIGAETALELGEVLDRVDDAVKATRAALRSGVVPGGGIALWMAAFTCETEYVSNALITPFLTICDNAGVDREKAIKMVTEASDSVELWTFNVMTQRVESPDENGIYDPLQVVISALRAAESVVNTMLSASGIVYVESKAPFDFA